MKRINFNEIIECSSQQSILTGQAGFGIRTFTQGMDAEWVRSICEQVNCAYEVGIADQVTAEQIAQDANVIKKYPRTLKYTAVKDDEGKSWYVIACSTYIDIDYGFFCGINSARRVGSNYIANILVFEEQPTPSLFYTLLKERIFLPVNNTCDANNPELKELLTGEPRYLTPRTIQIEEPTLEAAYQTMEINRQTALLAIALLQAKINQDLQKENCLQNVIIESEESQTPSILQDLGKLPAELVSDKYFQTNYLQGYGMPNGYRMVFLNEHNKEQVYIENYVYLNLRKKTKANEIEGNEKNELSFSTSKNMTENINTENYFFRKIIEAADTHRYDRFQAFINYLLQTKAKSDTDYKILYLLFIATKTDEYQELGTLNSDIYQEIRDAQLSEEEQQILTKSINNTLIHAIQQGASHHEMSMDEKEIVRSTINAYAVYCFYYPQEALLESVKAFLATKHILDEEKSVYLEIVYRLRTQPAHISGTYWEMLVAKRLGLDINTTRRQICERLFTYVLGEKRKPDLKLLEKYLYDSYANGKSEDLRKVDNLTKTGTKADSFMLIDCLWKIFKGQKVLLTECTPALINLAQWDTEVRKEYLAQCTDKDAKAFISKYYRFGSTLIRNLFKKK